MMPRTFIRKLATKRELRWCGALDAEFFACASRAAFTVTQETEGRQSVVEVAAFCLKHARRRYYVEGMRVGDVWVAMEIDP